MSLTYGFYNSVNHDRVYSADEISRLFDGIITDGVYAHIGKKMIVKSSSNDNEIIVQPGRAWFNGTWTYIDSELPVTVPTAEVVAYSNRIDALFLDINKTSRVNSLVWKSGSYSYGGDFTNLTFPTPTREDKHWQYPICYILRVGGQAKVKDTEIINAIGYTTVPNTRNAAGSPFVTGVLENISLDDMMTRWEAEFDSWCDAQKEAFTIWMTERETEYNNWFDTVKGTLSGDAAAGLKSYIESLGVVFRGTSSSTSTRQQSIKIGGVTVSGTNIPVNYLADVFGSHVMKRTITVSETAVTTATFTHSLLSDSDAIIDIFTRPHLDYNSFTISGNTATIEFPRSSYGSIDVKLRISTEDA